MPVAVVVLDFDPIIRLGGFGIRLDTAVTAVGLLAALVLTALLARRTPAGAAVGGDPPATLRLDDLLFVALAAAPGAAIGGRLGYVLVHLDYYRASPGAILDPGQGSLELTLAVAGAALTAGFAAHVLSGSAGRWFHVAALPTLVALGVGKLAMALGGRGQGLPASEPWATRYSGPGPWGSIAPEIPSHPAQLYEAGAIALVAIMVLALFAIGVFRRADGLAWIVAVALWLAARLAIASTWRDAPVLGPLRAEQILALLGLGGCLAVGALLVRGAMPAGSRGGREVKWPDPETRPRF